MEELRPTSFQQRVEEIPEEFSLVLSGGRGGGKSHCIARLTLRHCVERGPRASVLIVRRRLKSLLQFSEELRRLFKGAFGDVQYNAAESRFRLPNEAVVQLSHCESAAALSDIAQGMTFSLICVDEAGEGPPIEVIDQLGLALRGDPPLRMILACNPGGVNHSVILERYIKPPWKPFEVANKWWVNCPSTIEDNEHLPLEYRDAFEVLKKTDSALYHAHRHGDWSAIVGDYFANAWSDRLIYNHHDVPLDAFSNLKLGCDWGSAAPAAFLLGGRTRYDLRLPDDRIVPAGAWLIHDEHVEHDPNNIARGSGKTPRDIAPRVIEMCRRNRTRPRGVIDSSAYAQVGHGWSIGELFRNCGVSLNPAPKGPRVDRFEHLKTIMAADEFWVASRCKFWLRTVPSLPRSKRNPEDVDTDANDHALDATSYLIASARLEVTSGAFR